MARTCLSSNTFHNTTDEVLCIDDLIREDIATPVRFNARETLNLKVLCGANFRITPKLRELLDNNILITDSVEEKTDLAGLHNEHSQDLDMEKIREAARPINFGIELKFIYANGRAIARLNHRSCRTPLVRKPDCYFCPRCHVTIALEDVISAASAIGVKLRALERRLYLDNNTVV